MLSSLARLGSYIVGRGVSRGCVDELQRALLKCTSQWVFSGIWEKFVPTWLLSRSLLWPTW
eukprot:6483247-Amphidinium_carterae.2